MSQSELSISQLASLFESGTIYIHSTSRCKDVCLPVVKVAELYDGRPNGKIVFGDKDGEINQKFALESIPGTTKVKIAVETFEGTKVYVTSAKPVTTGDVLVVSTEGTVYAVGWNGSGHTISTKSENGTELFWTLEQGANGIKIALHPLEGGDGDSQGWRFEPAKA